MSMYTFKQELSFKILRFYYRYLIYIYYNMFKILSKAIYIALLEDEIMIFQFKMLEMKY